MRLESSVTPGVVVLREVTNLFHIVFVGAVEVRRAGNVEGHVLRHRLDAVRTRVARRDLVTRLVHRHLRHEVRHLARLRVLDLLREGRVRRLPGIVGLLPLVVLALQVRLVLLEVVARVLAYVPLLRREAERLASGVLVPAPRSQPKEYSDTNEYKYYAFPTRHRYPLIRIELHRYPRFCTQRIID